MGTYGSSLVGAWITVDEAKAYCASVADLADEDVEELTLAASEYLFERSARQFRGLTTATVRPTFHDRRSCRAGTGGDGRTSCSVVQQIDLGIWPITEVLSVTQDGAAVPSGAYRVDEYRYLVRLADEANDWYNEGWPTCQYMDRPTTAVGTFEVSVRWGRSAPQLGKEAAKALSCEMAKALKGEPCKLPSRAKTVSRQGVSVTMMDVRDALRTGRTGLQEVDLFLAAYNPFGLQRGMSVWSPDLNPRHRRAGT